MNFKPFITCAVTGSGDTADKHPELPITPEQIATASIEAAKAGAAVAHIHVRDPETGKGSRNLDHYKEVVDRVRSADVDVVLNLTAGMGGDLGLGPGETPMAFNQELTDLVGPMERIIHIDTLRPEICTLDCGSMNFGEGNFVVINTPDMLRAKAAKFKEFGVKPELEVFDTGHLWFVRQMVDEGLIDGTPLVQLCTGIPYGAPTDLATLLAMVGNLPDGAVWSSFGLGRMQMPWAAAAVLAGGNIRVGLEDNLYLERGVFASNAKLVEKARTVVEGMGATLLDAAGVREQLSLNTPA